MVRRTLEWPHLGGCGTLQGETRRKLLGDETDQLSQTQLGFPASPLSIIDTILCQLEVPARALPHGTYAGLQGGYALLCYPDIIRHFANTGERRRGVLSFLF